MKQCCSSTKTVLWYSCCPTTSLQWIRLWPLVTAVVRCASISGSRQSLLPPNTQHPTHVACLTWVDYSGMLGRLLAASSFPTSEVLGGEGSTCIRQSALHFVHLISPCVVVVYPIKAFQRLRRAIRTSIKMRAQKQPCSKISAPPRYVVNMNRALPLRSVPWDSPAFP